MYEMLFGQTPFVTSNKIKLYEKIKKGRLHFPDREKYQIVYSDEIKDLITKLLDKNKDKRLGSEGDWFEILEHPLFKD